MGEQLDARTAAARLGVDVRTLYAYVSRGSLRRVSGPDGRSSRYDSDELDLLARRSRPRTLPRPAASIDLVIATRVSTVTDGLVRYRGTHLLDLVAAGESFESVAARLWAGARAPRGSPVRPVAPARPDGGAGMPGFPGQSPAALIARALGDNVPVVRRFAAVVAGLTAPPSVSGAAAVAAAVAARCSPGPPSPARVRALNTALVLLAEHELAPWTAGWIAHAAEEYGEPPLRFRGRAVLPRPSGRPPEG
jgi:citrate synthase